MRWGGPRERVMLHLLATDMLAPAALRAAAGLGEACLRVARGCIAALAEAHAGRPDIDQARCLPPIY